MRDETQLNLSIKYLTWHTFNSSSKYMYVCVGLSYLFDNDIFFSSCRDSDGRESSVGDILISEGLAQVLTVHEIQCASL